MVAMIKSNTDEDPLPAREVDQRSQFGGLSGGWLFYKNVFTGRYCSTTDFSKRIMAGSNDNNFYARLRHSAAPVVSCQAPWRIPRE